MEARSRWKRSSAGVRRIVIALCAVVNLSHATLAVQAKPQNQASSQELRGVWFTANDMPVLRDRGRMQAVVNQLAALGFNRLYVVVWNSGFTYYPSQVSQQRQLQDFTLRGLQGQDFLGEFISAGRSRGIRVIPWFEFGFMTPPDSTLAKRHRAWLTEKRDGGLTSTSAAGEVVWLNPFRPEVQQLITDLVLEVVRQYDAEGIQFDDHMSLPRDFGYDSFTTALYRKQTGRKPPANPDDPAWVKWRADRITSFMAQLARAVRKARPGALISISPNYYDFAYKLQLQDWRSWVQQGIADELLVQIYRPELDSYLPHLTRPEHHRLGRNPWQRPCASMAVPSASADAGALAGPVAHSRRKRQTLGWAVLQTPASRF